MKKTLAALAAVIITINTANAACITSNCTIQKVFESWKGKQLDELIKAWGYPTKTKTVAGHKLYIYDLGKYTIRDQYGSKTREICTKYIEVDKENNIMNMEWKGGRCPSTMVGAKKLMNPQIQITEE